MLMYFANCTSPLLTPSRPVWSPHRQRRPVAPSPGGHRDFSPPAGQAVSAFRMNESLG